MAERIWERFLDERDSKLYATAGFGSSYGIGSKPALVIVDVTYGFAGDVSEKIEDSIKTYPFSCGEDSWKSIPHIRRLLDASREAGIPVFYTIIEGIPHISNERVAVKGNMYDHPLLMQGQKGSQVVKELEPIDGEIVISKKKPSAFFGTPLCTYLISRGVDSVIVTGTTTSGCVRATVIDAFSYDFKVVVPEECVFDRGIASHAINLFDMQQKYADVVSVDSVIGQLQERSGK